MATQTDHTEISPAMDYKAHEATYKSFTSLVKWTIIGLAVLVVFLYVVINP